MCLDSDYRDTLWLLCCAVPRAMNMGFENDVIEIELAKLRKKKKAIHQAYPLVDLKTSLKGRRRRIGYQLMGRSKEGFGICNLPVVTRTARVQMAE